MNRAIIIGLLGIALVLVIIVIRTDLFRKTAGEELNPQSKTLSQSTPSIGVYEVCSDISKCDIEAGIEKIKEAGLSSIVITVVDEDNYKSKAYYPSKYLPLAEYISDNYLEDIVRIAHKNNIKVFASINMPHNYWLAKNPDWIAYLSNGKKSDNYEQDYFHRIVPPSRLIEEKECQDLLKNIIGEVANYGIDGIDINDNFQFSDEYLEDTDKILYSSFDDFSINKFENDKKIIIDRNSPKDRAEYIINHSVIYSSWLRWRSEEVTRLIKMLSKYVKDNNPDIAFRPHLLTFGDPYQNYGLDYREISKNVDVLYLMITPEQEKEKYFDVVNQAKEAGAKKIAVSTYLFKVKDWESVEKDKDKILERIEWIKEVGADEIYIYDFRFIEEGSLWPIIKSASVNLEK